LNTEAVVIAVAFAALPIRAIMDLPIHRRALGAGLSGWIGDASMERAADA
jgi:hypothetical protein